MIALPTILCPFSRLVPDFFKKRKEKKEEEREREKWKRKLRHPTLLCQQPAFSTVLSQIDQFSATSLLNAVQWHLCVSGVSPKRTFDRRSSRVPEYAWWSVFIARRHINKLRLYGQCLSFVCAALIRVYDSLNYLFEVRLPFPSLRKPDRRLYFYWPFSLSLSLCI